MLYWTITLFVRIFVTKWKYSVSSFLQSTKIQIPRFMINSSAKCCSSLQDHTDLYCMTDIFKFIRECLLWFNLFYDLRCFFYILWTLNIFFIPWNKFFNYFVENWNIYLIKYQNFELKRFKQFYLNNINKINNTFNNLTI